MTVKTDDTNDRAILEAFHAWCRANRHLLGRDRLWPAYGAVWWAGTYRTDRSPQCPAKDLRRTTSRNQSDSIVRVHLFDWRRAARLDDLKFWRVLGELKVSRKIIREHGYARPAIGAGEQ